MCKVIIKGEAYTYTTRVEACAETRAAFNTLVNRVFGFDFENWHAAGWWGSAYQPHLLMKDGRAVANVSVNCIDFMLKGAPKRYLQLGTVMTAQEARGHGLAAWLMERVLEEYQGRADGVYLFANQEVLGFYPRFGFQRRPQTHYTTPAPPVQEGLARARRLDMDDPGQVALLAQACAKGNPYAALTMQNNPGLVMFYCGGPLKNAVYRLEDDTLAVAAHNGDCLEVLDLFGSGQMPLQKVLAALCKKNTRRIRLGFAPTNPVGFAAQPVLDDDEALFVLRGFNGPLDGLCFPALSIA